MTINTDVNKWPYTGNGATVDFSVPRRFFDEQEIVVIEKTIATGDEVEKILNVDYTVTGTGNVDGGTVTATAAPESTVEWIIKIEHDLTQSIDFKIGTEYDAEEIERAFDKLTGISQQLKETLDRVPTASAGTDTNLNFIYPTPEDGRTIMWDGVTGKMKNGPNLTEVANVAQFASDAADSQTAAEAAQTAAEQARDDAQNAVNGVAVSGNDTTPGTLESKLVQGSNITITKQNDGANESLLIDAISEPAGLTLLATATASNSASIDFQGYITSTYDYYILTVEDFVPAVNNADLHLRTSADGGVTEDGGGMYCYGGYSIRTNSAVSFTGIQGGGAAQITIAQDCGNEAGEYTTAVIEIFSPLTAAPTHIMSRAISDNGNTANVLIQQMSGANQNPLGVNFLRVLASGGLITSGTFKLYGVKK